MLNVGHKLGRIRRGGDYMKREKTIKVTVTLSDSKHQSLMVMAAKKGLPVPTYCRVLLSEIADTERVEQKAA